jgi:hypothetical protein
MLRKRRPKAKELVRARITWQNPAWEAIRHAKVQCGACGQQLPSLSSDDGGKTAMLGTMVSIGEKMVDDLWGWHWDGRVLRPTQEHVRRRQRARELVSTLPASATSLERERLRLGVFHRTVGDFDKLLQRRGLDNAVEQRREGRSVPIKIECAECSAENDVAVG